MFVQEVTEDGHMVGATAGLQEFLQDPTSARFAGGRVYAELGRLGTADVDFCRNFAEGKPEEIVEAFMAGARSEMEARSE
jgi:hypothetical protein